MTLGGLAAAAALALLVAASVAHAQLRPADAPPPSPTNNNDTRCGVECIRCAADGCIKCARLLLWPEGTCIHDCPSNTREAWAHDDHLMGRVCYPAHNYNEMLVGGLCGAVACVAFIAAGAAYVRCRGNARARAQPLPLRPSDDDTRLREFHKQLDCLRPHAYTLLAILNHTRRQVRELYQLGNNDAAMAYSCVLTDLAKLLILLNKQEVPVVPDEWPRLAQWAERILKRYSRLGVGVWQSQEGQLVNFLPSPPSQTSSDTQQSLSTFKPPSYSPTSLNSNMEKEIDSQKWSDLRPPSYSQICVGRESEAIVMSNPWERKPVVRRESVWLEDELFEMTRRPQDELTTEL